MRPNVPDPFTVERKVRTYRKHLEALTEARVQLYSAALQDKPIDVWVTRIKQLETEMAIGWPTPTEAMHREDYYANLRAAFDA